MRKLNASAHKNNFISSDQNSGAVAIIFALCLVPFILVTGMALELGRAFYADTRLSYACDAAAIAAARYQSTDMDINALKFFIANFPSNSLNIDTQPKLTVSKDQKMITVEVASTMPTYLTGLAGIDRLNVKAQATVQRSFNQVEVALVLDNTGSMSSNGKIAGLRTATTNLINILFQNKDTSPYVSVSIIPYVATVNIGSHYKDWLADPETLASFPTSVPWAGCVGAVDTFNVMDTDDPPSSSRKWPVYFAASTQGLFGTLKGNNDWALNGQALKVLTSIGGVSIGPNRSCGLPIQPLTNDRPTLLNLVNKMQPVNGGGTFGNLGLVWGWNTISPRWIGFWQGIDPKPYLTPNTVKYIIIVTDGENQWYAEPGYLPKGDPTAYGYVQPDKGNLSQGYLGTTTIGNSRNFIDQRLLDLCQKIKSKDINIITVTFEVSDPLAKQIYGQCASKSEYAFNANSSEEFNTIFQNIGSITQSINIVK